MATIGAVLMILGLGLSLVGGIWLIIAAFQESLLWGFLCLCFSPASIVFVVIHFEVAKYPVLLNLVGLLLLVLGAFLGGEFDVSGQMSIG